MTRKPNFVGNVVFALLTLAGIGVVQYGLDFDRNFAAWITAGIVLIGLILQVLWLVLFSRLRWPAVRVSRLAAAAMFLLLVGGALVYRATIGATQAMAAELAADHVKCFMMNTVLQTHESLADVEAYMRRGVLDAAYDEYSRALEADPLIPAPKVEECARLIWARRDAEAAAASA